MFDGNVKLDAENDLSFLLEDSPYSFKEDDEETH
jgi:hypothetical protein